MKLSRFKEFFTTKMRNRYRLIIRNDRNLAERISIILTPLNVILLLSTLLVFFTAVAIFLLPLTPIRAIMPGGGEVDPKEVAEMQAQLDSMKREIELRERRDSNLRRILRGEELTDTAKEVSHVIHSNRKVPGTGGWSLFPKAYGATNIPPVQTVRSQEKPDDKPSEVLKNVYTFFPPLKGLITDTFDLRRKHTAVDVVSYTNAAVKATLDGTVVMSSWNPETGHVMLIQHTDNLISVYKHNSVLLKEQGTRVRAGEVIALVGNSGELTSGPHLHFELWQNGQPVNPLDYIKF